MHTGKHETFCQSIQEALASGVPVIAPNSGGPLDLVKHGWTGYLIDTSNAVALNRAVNMLIHMQDPLILQQRTRESVIERNWQVVNNQLIGHYRELMHQESRLLKEHVA